MQNITLQKVNFLVRIFLLNIKFLFHVLFQNLDKLLMLN